MALTAAVLWNTVGDRQGNYGVGGGGRNQNMLLADEDIIDSALEHYWDCKVMSD